nr:uncharacterized protein LOC131758558 isoform X3 [Kogia breviceps]
MADQNISKSRNDWKGQRFMDCFPFLMLLLQTGWSLVKYSQHYSLGLPENRKGYGADRIVMNISLKTSVPHSEHVTECLHYAQAVTKQDAAPAAWELIKSRRSHMQITLKQSPSIVSLHLCFSMNRKVLGKQRDPVTSADFPVICMNI